jgi:hypothetical protein
MGRDSKNAVGSRQKAEGRVATVRTPLTVAISIPSKQGKYARCVVFDELKDRLVMKPQDGFQLMRHAIIKANQSTFGRRAAKLRQAMMSSSVK